MTTHRRKLRPAVAEEVKEVSERTVFNDSRSGRRMQLHIRILRLISDTYGDANLMLEEDDVLEAVASAANVSLNGRRKLRIVEE